LVLRHSIGNPSKQELQFENKMLNSTFQTTRDSLTSGYIVYDVAKQGKIQALTIYMGKPEIPVRKSNGFGAPFHLVSFRKYGL